MKIKLIAAGATLALLTLAGLAACSSTSYTDQVGAGELTTVQSVDLERYMGMWYEIARTPNPFQEGCTGTTATYELRDDGDVSVYNRCYIGSFDGEVDDAEGYGYVDDEATNAKLRVTFFWPFFGNYWIVELDEDYQWAVVSEPDRNYVWILSRSPQLEPDVYQDILQRMREHQLPVHQLMLTPQREQQQAVAAD